MKQLLLPVDMAKYVKSWIGNFNCAELSKLLISIYERENRDERKTIQVPAPQEMNSFSDVHFNRVGYTLKLDFHGDGMYDSVGIPGAKNLPNGCCH